MKTSIFFPFSHFYFKRLSGALLLFLAIFPLSCKKDKLPSSTDLKAINKESTSRDGDNFDNDYPFANHGISVYEGMLYFQTYDHVHQIISALDSFAYNNARNLEALNSLGFASFTDEDAPEEPALDVFNGKFNVTSLRQVLENLEQQEDETGQDLSAQTDKIIFWEPVLGSVINENNEIRIGNLIYKYIDGNRTVLLGAGNQTLLNQVRAATDAFSIEDQFNLFKIDSRKAEDLELYKKIETANRDGECVFDITWANTGNQYYFHSIGYFPTGNTVTWKIIDGNNQVLATQTGSQLFSFLVPTGATYPLYVSIESTGCSTQTKLFASQPSPAGYNCEGLDFTFTIDPVVASRFTFKIPANTPELNWDFGDGSLATSAATGNTSATITHIFPNGSNYNVCATVQTDNCFKKVCKPTGNIDDCGNISSFNQSFDRNLGYVNQFHRRSAKLKFSLRDPLFAKNRIFAKIKTFESTVSILFPLIVNELQIRWNSPPTESFVRYFSSNCSEFYEFAEAGAYTTSTLKAIREVPFGIKMRQVDVDVNFRVNILGVYTTLNATL